MVKIIPAVAAVLAILLASSLAYYLSKKKLLKFGDPVILSCTINLSKNYAARVEEILTG